MNNLIIIGAIGKNNEIGKNNKLIWYIPDDLKFFKENTNDHDIVMGYNTFISLPKLLENRKHIVLTTKDLKFPESVKVFHNINELLNYTNSLEDDVYIIGGANIYKLFIDKIDRMLLTEIDDVCNDADTYFPDFDKKDWYEEEIKKAKYNEINYRHVLYKRKNKCR